MWKETWNKAYRESDCYWGLNPNPKIVNFVKHIPSGKILDLGSGEGRNALYLAKKGYQVVCVDNSHAGISKCKEKADVLDVKAECRTLDIRDFTASDAEFSCIICHASLPFLKRSEADNIIACTKKWLCPKGVAFVSVFTTDDPLYKTYLEEGLEEIEQYTFFDPKLDANFCFFAKEELKKLFSDFDVLHYEEKCFSDSHGKHHHEHDMATIVAQRPE